MVQLQIPMTLADAVVRLTANPTLLLLILFPELVTYPPCRWIRL